MAESEAVYILCLILKSMLQKSYQNLRKKYLHIMKFSFIFSIFQCINHNPISIADFGLKRK